MKIKTKQITSLDYSQSKEGAACKLGKGVFIKTKTADTEIYFADPGFELQTQDGSKINFDPNKVYLLKFSINSDLVDNANSQYVEGYNLDVCLYNVSQGNFQILKTEKVLGRQNSSILNYTCVFKPLEKGFSHLAFKLKREVVDYQFEWDTNFSNSLITRGWPVSPQGTEYSGRFLNMYADPDPIEKPTEVTEVKLFEMNNLLSLIKDYSSIQRIGLQAKPRTIFSIDGEEMRVNKNGIYEVAYDNLNIQHIGLLDSDFILDITYTTKN